MCCVVVARGVCLCMFFCFFCPAHSSLKKMNHNRNNTKLNFNPNKPKNNNKNPQTPKKPRRWPSRCTLSTSCASRSSTTRRARCSSRGRATTRPCRAGSPRSASAPRRCRCDALRAACCVLCAVPCAALCCALRCHPAPCLSCAVRRASPALVTSCTRGFHQKYASSARRRSPCDHQVAGLRGRAQQTCSLVEPSCARGYELFAQRAARRARYPY